MLSIPTVQTWKMLTKMNLHDMLKFQNQGLASENIKVFRNKKWKPVKRLTTQVSEQVKDKIHPENAPT